MHAAVYCSYLIYIYYHGFLVLSHLLAVRHTGSNPGSLTVSSMTITISTFMSTLGSTLSFGTNYMALRGRRIRSTVRTSSGGRARTWQRQRGRSWRLTRRRGRMRILRHIVKTHIDIFDKLNGIKNYISTGIKANLCRK